MTEMRVSSIDLKAQYAAIREEVDAAIARVVESQRFVLGPEVEALESEIAAYCGSEYAIGCGSGSDAILLALMALGVAPGDDVVCPTYTFFSSAGSVSRLGARPIFADVDPDSFNVSAATLREAAKRASNLKAIVVVHLYGRAAPMDEILALGEELGVAVVEDAAQSIGSRDASGARVGSRGAIGCLSFFPTKNLGSFGDAGMLTTSDPIVAGRLRSLRVHGEEARYSHPIVGFNSRLDALQAAVLRVKLPYLEGWCDARGRNADTYVERLGGHGAALGAGGWGELAFPLRLPTRPELPARHTFHQFVIRLPGDRRDEVRERLAEAGVSTQVYYPIPLHRQKCFAGLATPDQDFRVADRAAAETLALPIHPELESDQIEYIVDTLVRNLG